MEQESLLTDLEYNPVLASVGKRFLNYLIDFIIFYIIIIILIIILNLTNSHVILNSMSGELFILILFFIYFSLFETIFKGRTIGKFITGTKVIMEDGTAAATKAFSLRSLCRLVPFEPFSAFGGRPWHDKWTRTFVIDVKQTALQNPTLQA